MLGRNVISAVPLSGVVVTAVMTEWLTIDDQGEECLFGYATYHTSTGGLSWVRSTPIVEFSAASDRARTVSGRVYALGRQVSIHALPEEGAVVLKLFQSKYEYAERGDDLAWVASQKVARHLCLPAPSRGDAVEVTRFMARHRDAYLSRMRGLGSR